MIDRTGEPGMDSPSDSDPVQMAIEALAMHRDITDRIPLRTPGLTPEQVRHRLEAGEPLISLSDWCPTWQAAKSVFSEWAEWAARGARPGNQPMPQQDVINEDLFKEVARAWDTREPPPEDASVWLTSLVGACLKPFLHAYSRQLVGLIEHEQWRRRVCPVCGGTADFGFLAKQDGARWLMCARCDATWLFQRLECPSCGTQNQSKLTYFADAVGRYRLHLCDECNRYLKAIDMRVSGEGTDLALERILTLNLDKQATDKGYRSPIT